MIVASATALSRLVGLAREVLTAGYYGVTADINMYATVSVVPNLVRQLFADAAISAAFVPVFTPLFSRGEKERAYRLAATLLGFMIVVVGAVVALLVVAAPLWCSSSTRSSPTTPSSVAWRRSCCSFSCRRCSSSPWPAS